MRKLLIALAIFCATTALAIWFSNGVADATGGLPTAPLDDAYIHFNYAKRIATGHGLTYSDGEGYTTGTTSILYPILLAFGYLTGWTSFSLATYANVLNTGFFLVTLALVVKMTTRGFGGAAGVAAAAALAVNGGVWANVLNGMDTLLFTMLLLLTVERAASAAETGRYLVFTLFASLTYLARPEGLVVASACVLYLAVSVRGRTGRLRPLAICSGIIFSVAAAKMLLDAHFAHTAIPMGLQAKSELFSQGIGRRQMLLGVLQRIFVVVPFDYLGGVFSPTVGPVSLFLFAIGVWFAAKGNALRPAGPVLPALVVLLTLWILESAFVLPVWQEGRYFMPLVPVFTMIVTGGIFSLSARVIPAPVWMRNIPVWACICLIAIGLPEHRKELATSCYNTYKYEILAGKWMAENLRENAVVAVTDAGARAYFSRQHIVDLAGLTSPGLVLCLKQLGGTGAVWEAMEHMPADRRPEFIYPDPGWLSDLIETGILSELPSQSDAGSPRCHRIAYPPPFDHPTTCGEGSVVLDDMDFGYLNSEKAKAFDPGGSECRTEGALSRDGKLQVDGTRSLSRNREFRISLSSDRKPGLVCVLRLSPRSGDGALDLSIAGASSRLSVKMTDPSHWVELKSDVPATSREETVPVAIRWSGRKPLILAHIWIVRPGGTR